MEVDLASVDTGNGQRDDHLRDPDFFEVERYPTATVKVHSVRPAPAGAEGAYEADFDIDLHGVQRTLVGNLRLVSPDPLEIEGDLLMNRSDFGVGAPHRGWNPLSVRPDVPVTFRVRP